MNILVACPQCNSQYQVDLSHPTVQFKCQNCGQLLFVEMPKRGAAGVQAPAPLAAPPTPPSPLVSLQAYPAGYPRPQRNQRSGPSRGKWINVVVIGGGIAFVLISMILAPILLNPKFGAKKIEPESLAGDWFGRGNCAINLPRDFQLQQIAEKPDGFSLRWTLDASSKSENLTFSVTTADEFVKNSRPEIHTESGSYFVSGPGHFFVIEGGTVERILVGDVLFYWLEYPPSKREPSKSEFAAVARLQGKEVIIKGVSHRGADSKQFRMLRDVVATFQERNLGVDFPRRPK